MSELSTLLYVLEQADHFPANQALFLPKNKNWSLDSQAIVWDPDDCDGDEELPEVVSRNNLVYVFGIGVVQDIVINVKQQKSKPSKDELMKAFMFYYEHDAFISFEDL
jgi:hypothetical protein